MDGLQVICTVFVTVVSFCAANPEYMVSEARSIAVAIGFETKLECLMNIQPDNFQWKFYPLDKKEAYNPKARISLTTSLFRLVPDSKYNSPQKRISVLTLQANSTEIAGDYQCLAHYGAVVRASIPWRVTISRITNFPPQKTISETVVQGNTINWRCEPPIGSNPEPYVDYFKNGTWFKSAPAVETKSLILPNVTPEQSGSYTCKAGNVEGKVDSPVSLNLKVVQNGRAEKPRFIIKPNTKYKVEKGKTVFLECAAVGNPPPEVVWRKEGGIIMEKRSEVTEGGLIIRNVQESDGGVYKCTQKNPHGFISELITLEYTEPPNVVCSLNTTDVTQGDNLDLDCFVTGVPKPEITWFLNGFAVTDHNKITTDGNKIFFHPAEKLHAGRLQMFARNDLGTVFGSILIKVIPLSTTQEASTDLPVVSTRYNHKKNTSRKGKHNKMVPPSKPTISRISDEAVLVRWSVQANKGLPIRFFKVQYKELGAVNQHDHTSRKASKWMTTNADIEAHIQSYEVTNLKPDHVYRFRIAAVYANDDNKNSPNSEKFVLRRLDFDNRNPLPVPIITNAEPVNSTSVKIYWKLDSVPNITVEGYFVNYNSASSAADYMKATVDGASTKSYVLSHLQPDTVYDIKLQSFTSKSASQFSHIQKVKTLGVASTTVVPSSVSPPNIESAGTSKLYIFIAAGVLGGCCFIFAAVGVLMLCRKWKQKKNSNTGVDDCHIQVDGNEYVVGPKGPPRSNGCVPSSRMTITANPLADADNKNQNMIEMSCLSSQNNNCSTVQPSVSGEDLPTNSRDKKNKNREKRIRDKRNVDSNTSGENFV